MPGQALVTFSGPFSFFITGAFLVFVFHLLCDVSCFFFCKRIMACWDNSHGLLGTRVVGYLVQSYWIQESLVNGYKSHGLLGIRSMGYWVQ